MKRTCKFRLLSHITTALICISMLSCSKKSVDQPRHISFTKSQEEVLNSSNQSGINLFKDLTASPENNQNFFISPVSISFALTMTYNGAAHQTATDMQNVLSYNGMSKTDINQSCKELTDLLISADPRVAMEIANSIWYRNTFTIKDSFLNLNRNYFGAEVQPSDFDDPQTVNIINNWVSAKTHKKITSVITEIPSDAIMYLINAIYFKGNWKYRFETKNTIKMPFYQADGSNYETDFMNQKGTFRYTKNDLLSAVELPYGNGSFSMVVLLPNTGKTYADVISSLSCDNWNQWNNHMDSANVFVQLPRFKFKYEKTLNQNLTNLGMGIAFDPASADFSNISEAAQLYISFVLHKSFVDVNEEGTEAAAVTVVGINATAYPGEPVYQEFNVNKPFVFAIKENTTNSILFIGLVMKPVAE